MEQLMVWAREAEPPLSVYATGLLARAMSSPEEAARYREHNAQLVGAPGCPPAYDCLLMTVC